MKHLIQKLLQWTVYRRATMDYVFEHRLAAWAWDLKTISNAEWADAMKHRDEMGS